MQMYDRIENHLILRLRQLLVLKKNGHQEILLFQLNRLSRKKKITIKADDSQRAYTSIFYLDQHDEVPPFSFSGSKFTPAPRLCPTWSWAPATTQTR